MTPLAELDLSVGMTFRSQAIDDAEVEEVEEVDSDHREDDAERDVAIATQTPAPSSESSLGKRANSVDSNASGIR